MKTFNFQSMDEYVLFQNPTIIQYDTDFSLIGAFARCDLSQQWCLNHEKVLVHYSTVQYLQAQGAHREPVDSAISPFNQSNS